MKQWLSHAEHGDPGEVGTYGWAHPKTGLIFQGRTGNGHAKEAAELGFQGETGTETIQNAIEGGYTRWYVAPGEIGVHFNKDCPDAPKRAKEILAYHAQNQQGRMLLADTGVDYYHGTSLKDAHDFIDRVSTKMKGRKETDYARMKRELGESRADTMIRMALNESYLKGAVAPVYHWTRAEFLPSILQRGLMDADYGHGGTETYPNGPVSLTRDRKYFPHMTKEVRLTIDKERMQRDGHKFHPHVDDDYYDGLGHQQHSGQVRDEAEELHKGRIDPKYITGIAVSQKVHDRIKVHPDYEHTVKHPGYKVGFEQHEAVNLIRRALNEGSEHKAWISPQGEIHHVDNDQSHHGWIEDNEHHIEPQHLSGIDVHPHSSDIDWEEHEDNIHNVACSMLHGGWIRKGAKDAYDVGSEKDFGRVLSHVRAHHPEVKTAYVYDRSRGDAKELKVWSFGGSESFDEATLRPHSDNVPGSGRARYDIEHEGKRIGNLAVQTVSSAPELPAGSRAGKLGVRLNPDARGSRALVRDVLRQLRDRHPDLTHVGGFRLSGTRAHWDNDQKKTTDRYTWVKLR